jgi:biopolymer transport protein ExbB
VPVARSILALGVVSCAFDPSGSAALLDGGMPDSPIDAPAADEPPFARAIDVTGAGVTGGPHESFPLLVALEEPWLRHTSAGGRVEHLAGFDIRFSQDPAGDVPLDHEIEGYQGDTGELIAWVRIPMLAADTVLYLHYGDDTITASQENTAGVWSGGFAAVWHMDEALADSAGLNGVATNSGSEPAIGWIGEGRRFDGTADFVDTGSAQAIDNVFAGGGTAEGWLYATGWGESSYGRLFDKGHQSGWSMGVSNNAPASSLFFVRGATSSYGHWNTPVQSLSLDRWTYVAVVYDQGSTSNDAVMYIDGEAVEVTRVVSPGGSIQNDASATLYLGNRPALDRTFDGTLDELRLSAVPRSAGWIATTFRNQSDPSAFYTVGPER